MILFKAFNWIGLQVCWILGGVHDFIFSSNKNMSLYPSVILNTKPNSIINNHIGTVKIIEPEISQMNITLEKIHNKGMNFCTCIEKIPRKTKIFCD